MIRTILVVLSIAIFLIVTLPVLLIEWIIGKFNTRMRDISSLRIVQAELRIILWLTGAKVTVIGKENIPEGETVLYVGNHRSYFDIVVSYIQCKNLTGYVSKDGLKKVPLLSFWMKRLYCLFLNREDIRQGLKTILAGIEQMKNGISMCIYPEGTRSQDDEMLPFKEGSLKLAEKSGCPIIPMAVTGTEQIFEKHVPFIKPAHVILEYGKPIYPKELSKEEKKFLGAYTRGEIEKMLKNHKEMAS